MCSKTDARAKIVIIADLPFAEFGRKISKFYVRITRSKHRQILISPQTLLNFKRFKLARYIIAL